MHALVASVQSSFASLLECELERSELALSNGLSHDVSGIIGLTGLTNGLVAVSLSRSLALRTASSLLMEEILEINDDVSDAVGELANMIVGSAKSKLETSQIAITVPTVIVGDDHQFRFPARAIPIRIPFHSDAGCCTLEIGLVDDWEPVEFNVELLKARLRAPVG
ncbi:MAG: chemotaxis protein CheX [Pirellulaceae bacterium]